MTPSNTWFRFNTSKAITHSSKHREINNMKNKTRTTATLRTTMFDQLDRLIDGDITPQEATASARLAAQVVSITKLELESSRFVSDSGKNGDSLKAIKF